MKLTIVLPAFNEQDILAKSVSQAYDFCLANLQVDWQIVIADNDSRDSTAEIGKDLATKLERVKYLFVKDRGKGLAIRNGWNSFPADAYCFMDADLATDLSALPIAVALIKDGVDCVTGSRFHKKSKVKRTLLRKFFSYSYHFLTKLILGTNIKDLPCGFKAISHQVKEDVLPLVLDNEWFFDSELVILAEANKYRVKEIPVTWEDPREESDKSRVQTLSLSRAYFRQILSIRQRLRR